MALGCWGEDSDHLRLNVSANRYEAGPNPASRFFGKSWVQAETERPFPILHFTFSIPESNLECIAAAVRVDDDVGTFRPGGEHVNRRAQRQSRALRGDRNVL